MQVFSRGPLTKNSLVQTKGALRADSSFGTISLVVQLTRIVLIAGSIYLLRAWMLQGFTRAESCFAEGAREMFTNRQYIAPLLDNNFYFDKPPLYYWFLIAGYNWFGVSLFCARSLSTFLAVVVLMTNAIFVNKFLSARVAMLSTMILATSMCFYEFASVAMPDMALCLCEIVSAFCLFSLTVCHHKQQKKWVSLSALFISFGWLVKGPIALIIPGTAFGVYSLMCRSRWSLSRKELTIFSLILLLILLPWHIAAYKYYGLTAFQWLYWRGMFGRYIGTHQDYNFGHVPTYMFTSLLSGFLPWTIFLIPALGLFGKDLLSKKSNRESSDKGLLCFLLIWAVINITFFSLSKSNWGYYNLPIMPALSVLTAYLLDNCVNLHSGCLRTWGIGISTGSFLACIPLIQKACMYLGNISSAIVTASQLVAGAIIVLVLWLFATRRFYGSFYIIAMTFALCMVIYSTVFLPVKAQRDDYLRLVEKIKYTSRDFPLIFDSKLACQYLLTDYVALTCRRIPNYFDCKISQSDADALPSPAYYVLVSDDWNRFLTKSAFRNVEIVDSAYFKFVNFPGCELATQPHMNITKLILVKLTE